LVAGRPPGAEAGVNAQPAAVRGLVGGGFRWNIPALGPSESLSQRGVRRERPAGASAVHAGRGGPALRLPGTTLP
jgi:hypothetical protein